MSENSYTVFNAMVDIVASPGKALDEVKSHTSWLWWPLLISIGLASGLFVYYFSWVDFPWLVEETIRQIPAESRAESADGVRQFMTPGKSTMFTLVAVVVMTLVIYTVQTTYLHLANKLTAGADIGWGQWFSFSTWTAFVGVFATIAAFVLILMTDNNQLSTTDLQPLSLNSLFINANPGFGWGRWGSSLSLINFWMLFLMSIGFARWTNTPIVKSTIIAVLPWFLIFGIWALMI